LLADEAALAAASKVYVKKLFSEVEIDDSKIHIMFLFF
jgi:hypothetical protein